MPCEASKSGAMMLEFIRSSYFQGLLNSLSIGLVIFNDEGTVYALNNPALSLLGLSSDNHVGSKWTQLVDAFEDKEALQAMVRIVAENVQSSPERLTTRFARQDGQILHVALSASPLLYYDKLFGIVLEMSDITDLYQSHQRERRMLEERNFLQQERYESLQKMSMSVAHQLRNPITTIGGMAHILIKGGSPSSHQMECFDAIIASMHRLEAVVTAVYEYGALVVRNRILVGTDNLIHDAREMSAKGIPELAAKAAWDVEVVPYQLVTDPLLLSKALCEIFMNSLEALPLSGGKITVSGIADAETYRIEISDNGRGIAESDLLFIFDPFFTRKTVGVGMGLCKAERIVHDLGGHIEVKSVEGLGTTVKLVFNRR
jgi:PAS domain S-box-containing protein